ncbi:MAG: glycoside hydrolase family 2 protein [Chloroflexi bacterium]|nr:glycoside hydrolase family 2 protein [Chloroflexota bacterium]
MDRFTLNGMWSLRRADGEGGDMPAPVPGCVHTALLAAGRIPDPFFRDQEKQQMWVGETDWLYQRDFDVPPEILARDRVLLRCHGLDTLATITLNGQRVARTENMFRTYEFDVKSLLGPSGNRLAIVFDAPMTYAVRMDAEKGAMDGWVEPMRINSGAWIRKEPCNFGWDWGPKMVTSGIWREIELVAFDTARLTDVDILQSHNSGQVTLAVRLAAECFSDHPVTANITVRLAGQIVASAQAIPVADGLAQTALAIAQPRLWWPKNMGDQPLYTVEVTLNQAGAAFDTATRKIGLRTLTLERHADQWGESFYFACNGVPYFAKGANWIPVSPYPGTVTPTDYELFVKAAADANMNMLRVWGGGIYEDDAFYDLCDQYGVTVWQDFMFACGTYPASDADFMANVAAEARDNVRRIRHHACMALWCGNNEIEQGMQGSGWHKTMNWEQYESLFDHLLGDIVRELAPQTAYWPASPHSPLGDRADWINPNWGDTHLWMVWHGKEPFEWYRTRPDRFCSEFGFQSFPEPQVIDEFTLPSDRNITSYVLEHHQRSGIGNSTIIHYMLDWYKLPSSFESTIWLSQILQGMAMKYAVEHWRRNMPRTMGTLYWQLNDMWPAASWASVDWKGNFKALHYMAKRFYAPLLISGLEHPAEGTVDVHVTSDQNDPVEARVAWSVTDVAGKVLAAGEQPATLAPRTSACVTTLALHEFIAEVGVRNLLVWLDLFVGDQRVSDNLVLFARPKHMDLTPPEFSVSVQPVEGQVYDVTVSADRPALYVWLEMPGARFSDGFFDLNIGRSRTVRVTAAAPITAFDLHEALTIQSLASTSA